jgi:hypothetical protein
MGPARGSHIAACGRARIPGPQLPCLPFDGFQSASDRAGQSAPILGPVGSKKWAAVASSPRLGGTASSAAVNPTHDRGWVDAYTALLHHLGEITVADPVLAVLAHAQQDRLDRKATALEQGQQDASRRAALEYIGRVNATVPNWHPVREL